MIKANLDKLASLLDQLEWKASTSEWSAYSERSHYAAPELEHKAAFVRAVGSARHRRGGGDVGCNDGYFSRLVADHADCVVALDADPLVVDQLYRALRNERDARILPLYMNLADPSPGIGWRGRERLPLPDRAAPDLILALAVIHHMTLTANVPIPDVVDFFADLTPELVIEFPTPDDQMVKRLLRNKREGVHDDYTLERFEAALASRFDVRQRDELEGGTRVMYHAVRR
jgi:SAM-dependent methyltransferase